ncbi:MAG: diphthine--ammonia ligase [Ruminococcus sp.]
MDFENSFDEMPDGEPFICSFSGGKDSVIALSMAWEKGEAKGLINWFDEEQNKSVFHNQDLDLIKLQAECVELPLYTTRYTPWSHRVELIDIYKRFSEQGIKSIIFGDIYLADSAKLQTILCKKAGLIPRFPLWNKDLKDLYNIMQNRKIKTIISRVNTAYLNEEWLGKEYNMEMFDSFCKMGIDPFGEKGEFHTTVIDADIFKVSLLDKLIDEDARIQLSAHELKDNIYRLLKNEYKKDEII